MNKKTSEPIRLQKYFTDCGITSRRAAEAEILAGNVTVNGRVATLGQKILPGVDTVTFNGKVILPQSKNEHTYIFLNKPRGYLCSLKDPQGRKCVTELLTDVPARVYPVGRLDLISEGLLLLTDDGELANRLTHPRHQIPKQYRVKVAGAVTAEQYGILTSPLVIDGYQIEPVKVRITQRTPEATVLHMTLYEGRNRQIRKMCEQAGLTVKRLGRVSIGSLGLNGLPVGKWRYLEEHEVEYLYKHSEIFTETQKRG